MLPKIILGSVAILILAYVIVAEVLGAKVTAILRQASKNITPF